MKLCKGVALALTVSYGLTYCHTTKSKLTLEQQGDSLTVIHITNPTNYILLSYRRGSTGKSGSPPYRRSCRYRYGYSFGTESSGLFCSLCFAWRNENVTVRVP